MVKQLMRYNGPLIRSLILDAIPGQDYWVSWRTLEPRPGQAYPYYSERIMATVCDNRGNNLKLYYAGYEEFHERWARIIEESPMMGGDEMRKKRHVYISGPMTGVQYYNGPSFVAMERALRIANPHILKEDIYNPYDFVDEMKDLPHSEAVRLSLLELLKSDEDGNPWYTDILMIEGYQDSIGASAELHAAKSVGMTVTLFDEFDANEFHLNGDDGDAL